MIPRLADSPIRALLVLASLESERAPRHYWCSVRVKVARYYIKFDTHLAHELRSARRAEGLVRGGAHPCRTAAQQRA